MTRLFTNAKRRSKKAQFSQAFTYIAIILVIGAIAAVGAKAILSLLNANCEAKKGDFTRDITKMIDANSDRGSVIFETVAMPCDVNEICFVDAAAMNTAFTHEDPIIADFVRERTHNVFIKGKFTEGVINSPKLSVPGGGALCLNATSGYVKLKFEGTGKTTIVSQG